MLKDFKIKIPQALGLRAFFEIQSFLLQLIENFPKNVLSFLKVKLCDGFIDPLGIGQKKSLSWNDLSPELQSIVATSAIGSSLPFLTSSTFSSETLQTVSLSILNPLFSLLLQTSTFWLVVLQFLSLDISVLSPQEKNQFNELSLILFSFVILDLPSTDVIEVDAKL